MIRAICIGEALVELRPAGPAALSRAVAGDVYNTAVYLRRSLGAAGEVSFLTVLGSDPLSAGMIAAFEAETIDTRRVFIQPGRLPGLYLIEVDERGERTFLYWRGESAARRWLTALETAGGADTLAGADLVMFSGISLAILSREERRRALALLASLRGRVGRIAFDPNVRPVLWADPAEARESLTTAFGVADIVLASQDDGAWLWGESEPNAQIERILTLGAREAVVTLGAGGVTLSADGEAATARSLAGVIIDTSGAGDSFNGGYLAARLSGASPLEAARAGQSLAARVVSHPGALIPGEFSHPKSATPHTDTL